MSAVAGASTPARPAAPGHGSPLGVVIVHYGEPGPTLACVASVLDDPSPTHRLTLVVDNSATLPRHRLPPEVHYLASPDNPGFGAAVNRGIGHLGADPGGYVILNGDIELLPGYLAAAANAVAAGAGAAGGPLYLGTAAGPLWYAGGHIHPFTGTVRQSRSAAHARRRRQVTFIPGAALVVAAGAWRGVGGFDPAFFLYNEDVDLCLRLRRAGFTLLFEPSLSAVHHLGAATGSHERSPFYLEHLTRTRLLPFPSRPHRLYLAVLHSGWLAVRTALILLRRGRAGLPAVRALARGHRAALASAWSRRLPR